MKPPLKTSYANDFQTPDIALNPLYPYIENNLFNRIWECAEGKGNLTKALKESGYDVIGTDILKGQNFITYEPEEEYDCIITNPPYQFKQQFLNRAYSLGKPFAFLLPLTTLETKKRQSLFKKYGLELIFFDKRINFETPSGNGSGAWFAVMWLTYKFNIGKELNFVELK